MAERAPTLDEYVRVAELRATLRRFARRTERIARQERLTPRRYLLLLMIKGSANGSERSTVTELSDRLQLQQSTVTELVRRAEEAGLLARQPSPEDGRVVYLFLTPEGERRLEAVVSKTGVERKRLVELIDALEAAGAA